MSGEGPDRGYSWMIVFCCSYIHFAIFGLFRSWGVIYVAVLQTFNVTREEASWPFSLCATVFQLMGPFVSIITHYISKRAACILGCCIATFGIVGCYFAETVMWITIFYGVIHGLGFGIVVTLIPVILNQYFVKHRATAIGIAFSGGSISSFGIPIVMEWLLENYQLKGSFLLLGGLVMNTVVASALLRPPPWRKTSKKTPSKLLDDSEAKDSGVSTGDVIHDNKEREVSAHCLAIECESHPELHDSVFIDNDQEVENEDTVTADIPQQDATTTEENSSEKQDTVMSNNDSVLFGGSVCKIYTTCETSSSCKCNKSDDKDDCGVQEPLMKGKDVYIIPTNKTPKKKKRRFKCTFHHSIVDILKTPMFHLITYTMFIFFVSLQSFMVVIVDYAKDKGIAETEGVYIMSVFSISDLIGRSGLGWITDRNYVKRKTMVIFNLTVLSIIMQLYPIISDLSGMLAVAAFHGLSAGSCITLFFVLQADYLGLKNLTLVVGLTSFINGVLSLLRPAIIGVFRDTIGSYDWMFHSLGICCFTFAFIWLTESWMTRDRPCPKLSSSDKNRV